MWRDSFTALPLPAHDRLEKSAPPPKAPRPILPAFSRNWRREDLFTSITPTLGGPRRWKAIRRSLAALFPLLQLLDLPFHLYQSGFQILLVSLKHAKVLLPSREMPEHANREPEARRSIQSRSQSLDGTHISHPLPLQNLQIRPYVKLPMLPAPQARFWPFRISPLSHLWPSNLGCVYSCQGHHYIQITITE